MKSTHKAEVVPVEIEKHPNADALGIVRVFGGYTCCVRLDDWKGKTKAAFVPPDSLVPIDRPEFSFLAPKAKSDGKARIRAMKLRGVQSFGLLVPVSDDTPVGEDYAERLGITHYDPEVTRSNIPGTQVPLFDNAETVGGPNVVAPRYDVDALRRYHELFVPGEPVIITEKLDGSNARYVYHDGKMYCGSRNQWKAKYPDYSKVTIEKLVEYGVEPARAQATVDRLHSQEKRMNMWWEALERTPELECFCRDHPDTVVYGEVFGSNGKIKYGLPTTFAAFDLLKEGTWVDGPASRDQLLDFGVMVVPLLAPVGAGFDFDQVCQLADGYTTVLSIGGEPLVFPDMKRPIREGCVVKPISERVADVGRVQLKAVSAAYLEKY